MTDIIKLAREAGFITGTRDLADGTGGMPYVQSVASVTFLPELKRFQELVAAQEREAFKNAVYVAITMLFDSHRDDVARTFSIAELQRIADHTDALGNEQVENIYRAAFDKFDEARAKEQTP
jgi:hypothetical protein